MYWKIGNFSALGLKYNLSSELFKMEVIDFVNISRVL